MVCPQGSSEGSTQRGFPAGEINLVFLRDLAKAGRLEL